MGTSVRHRWQLSHVLVRAALRTVLAVPEHLAFCLCMVAAHHVSVVPLSLVSCKQGAPARAWTLCWHLDVGVLCFAGARVGFKL
jgi:hypothetical protein